METAHLKPTDLPRMLRELAASRELYPQTPEGYQQMMEDMDLPWQPFITNEQPPRYDFVGLLARRLGVFTDDELRQYQESTDTDEVEAAVGARFFPTLGDASPYEFITFVIDAIAGREPSWAEADRIARDYENGKRCPVCGEFAPDAAHLQWHGTQNFASPR